jgi:predicted RNA binding protein YcfA (HicA-like mRNA interferase family)
LSKFGGSYVIMKRETKGCVAPMHKEVKVGTLAGILRQAEVSPEEFLAALQE